MVVAQDMNDLSAEDRNACIDETLSQVTYNGQGIPIFLLGLRKCLYDGVGCFTFHHLAVKNQPGTAVNEDKTALSASLFS